MNVRYLHPRLATPRPKYGMGFLTSNGDVNDPNDPMFGAKNPSQLSAYLGLVAASWSLKGAIGGFILGAAGVLAAQHFLGKAKR